MPPARPLPTRILCGLVLISLGACAGSVYAPVQTRDRDQPAAATAADSPTPVTPLSFPGQHTVQKGDTLYSIAWRYGSDYRDVARWNRIEDPFVIMPGQVLRLRPPVEPSVAPPAATEPEVIATTPLPTTTVPPLPTQTPTATPSALPPTTPRVATATIAHDPNPKFIRWQWPTRGRLVRSRTPTSKNGIDISGQRGQSIAAAAPGSVVYSGSGLLGYGRLIIVKHSDTYLSAYAHNETLLVKEGDRVSPGQQIATMGIGSGGAPILHFEIRKDGKPVNPLEHLPKVRS